MRVLINYATYADRITIHCLAADARPVIGPQKSVSNPETLYRLIAYVGGDAEQCREEIHKWGHGGCWADVKPEHFALLGIKKMPQQEAISTGRLNRAALLFEATPPYCGHTSLRPYIVCTK